MLKTLIFKAPILLSYNSRRFNTIAERTVSLQISPFPRKSPDFGSFLSNAPQIYLQNPIICARKRRKRINSDKSTRFLINLISVVASSLKILPQPLDLVLEEIGGGDGTAGGCGGLGFWKGFGWGGFDGWRKRRRKRNLWLYGFIAICGLGLLFGREIESNAFWWGLGLGPFGVALIQWWEKTGGVQAWVLGLCLWSFLVGLTFRREELQKWLARFRVTIPLVDTSLYSSLNLNLH
ncbi:uncharacterized protein LOC21386013 [Morus notabilis]|uniref:uncharacterized protein LOC21386013 n=1 Tax=Morus notabilis TaxID=981085 RepID=UPI000CED1023|nr:uncharacterized protein LOC21386013 [Morus notabilis]